MTAPSSWHAYPKVWALGHRAIQDILKGPVLCQEKIDGSQISWGVFGGVLRIRSRGTELVLDAPDKMFQVAVDELRTRQHLLEDGWTYRGEFLRGPHHNALAYDRVPKGHIALFDINYGEESYAAYAIVRDQANLLGFDVVPLIYEGMIDDPQQIHAMLDRVSILGGAKIEGVVVKRYDLWTAEGKAAMGKYVSEAFKEVHKQTWTTSNPKAGDILQMLCTQYHAEARWEKAVQHLRDTGQLQDDPHDIGPLIKAVQRDLVEECEPEIKDTLWKWASAHVLRSATAGLPEWYKAQLLERAFATQQQ